ncbi:MAG: transporter substrate-binding domain-containing protein [Myxococcota bacterium]|nr:transporter substrate-binding domain-containing protein [Myxococcota bacterium]
MRAAPFRLVVALMFAWVLALPDASRAGGVSPVVAGIAKRGDLRVGMSGSQPPLNFERGGRLVGLDVDLARAIGAMMGVRPVIVRKPFAELLGALESGEVDVVISGMTINPGRNMRAAFIGPYLTTGKSILTRSAQLGEADDPGDLDSPDITLAAVAGSTSQDYAQAFMPKAKLRTPASHDEAVRLLLAGEVQAVVADHEVCAFSVARNRRAGLINLAEPLTVEPLGIAVVPGDAHLLNLLENILASLDESDLTGSLRRRWIETGSWVDQLP